MEKGVWGQKVEVNFKKTKVVMIGSQGEVLKSEVDPRAKCGKRVIENSVMHTKCSKWVHARCAKMKSNHNYGKRFD